MHITTPLFSERALEILFLLVVFSFVVVRVVMHWQCTSIFLFVFSYIFFIIREFQKILDSCLGTSDINELKQSGMG